MNDEFFLNDLFKPFYKIAKKKKWVLGIFLSRTISLKGSCWIWKSLKSFRVNNLNGYSALIKAVEAWNYFLNLKRPISCVYNLLFQSVLFWLVQDEIEAKSLIQKRVFALEYDLKLILFTLVNKFSGKFNLVIIVFEMFFV